METKKMSLATVAGKLSRAEMKNVMAGNDSSLEPGNGDTASCNVYCDQGYACKGACSSCESGPGLGDRKMCVRP